MAYFKLSLLDFMEDGDERNAKFLSSTMSEFYSQQESHNDPSKITFCYTYNESLNLHTNAQKELSFSIDRMILKDNEWVENPFSRYIVVGAQLLLEDNYHNQYLFIVKDIKYTFKPQNMIAAVTCQDAFSYQLSRQNDGYEITNDTTSDDFIGAKDIDWWVTNKIVPECYVSYNYVKLGQGIYIRDKKAYVFDNSLDLLNNTNIKLVKTPYLRSEYSDYYETFAFSGSGTANSILISLGEKIGLMMQTFELLGEDGQFYKYFWFEPQQHEINSGLYYSPFSSIQSFSLSHSGSSLTTVLNVSGASDDDENVCLLPEISPFISQSFTSPEWINTKWDKNFFHRWIRERTVHYQSNKYSDDFRVWHSNSDNPAVIKNTYTIHEKTWKDDSGKECSSQTLRLPYIDGKNLYLPVSTDDQDRFLITSLYENYGFNEKDHRSEIVINKQIYNTLNSAFALVYIDKDGKKDENIFNYIGSMQSSVWLRISFSKDELIKPENQIESENIYFRWYRDPTESDITFAEIADEVPWLENKLINFGYFQKNNLLSPEEIKNLNSLIFNDLRIANGKLLFYSKQYYSALHAKTKILADMENQFDVLGANFYSDVVAPYASDKIVTDIQNFTNAYKNIYETFDSNYPNNFLNYDETYSSYINKYVNAQQSFLKNIYNFTTYFNYPVDLNKNMCLFEDRITIQNSDSDDGNTRQIVSFTNNFNSTYTNLKADDYDSDSQSLTFGKPRYDGIFAFYKDSSTITKPHIAYRGCPEWNRLSYIDPEVDDNQMQEVVSQRYDPNQRYYQVALQVQITKDQFTEFSKADENVAALKIKDEIGERTLLSGFSLIQKEEKYFLQVYPKLEPITLKTEIVQINFNGNEIDGTYSHTYRPISDNEIKTFWYWRKNVVGNSNYRIRLKNQNYQPISKIFDSLLESKGYWNSYLYKEDNNTDDKAFRRNFFSKIPLSSFYFRDHYWKTIESDDRLSESYQLVNSTGKTLQDYLDGNTESNPLDEYKYYEVPLLNSSNIGKYFVLGPGYIAAKNIEKTYFDWAFTYIGDQSDNQNQFFDWWGDKPLVSSPIAAAEENSLSKMIATISGYKNPKLSTSNLVYFEEGTKNDEILTGTTHSVYLRKTTRVPYPVFANKFFLSWGTLYSQKTNSQPWSENNLHQLDINSCYYKDRWLVSVKEDDIKDEDKYYFIPIYLESQNDNSQEFINNNSIILSKYKDGDNSWKTYWSNYWSEIPIAERTTIKKGRFSAIALWPFDQKKLLITKKGNNLSAVNYPTITQYGETDLYTGEYMPTGLDKVSGFPKITAYGILCREEDYVEAQVKQDDLFNNSTIYNEDNERLKPLEESDCINSLYVKRVFDKQELLAPAKDSDFNISYHYYDEEGNRYYTVPQLLQEAKNLNVEYKYLSSNIYKYTSLSKDTMKLTLELQVLTEKYNLEQLNHEISINDTSIWAVVGNNVTVTFDDKETFSAKVIEVVADSNNSGKAIIRLDRVPAFKTVKKYRVIYNGTSIEEYNGETIELNSAFFNSDKIKVLTSSTSTKYKQDFETPDTDKLGTTAVTIKPNSTNNLLKEITYKWYGMVVNDLNNTRTMGGFWYRFRKEIDQPILFNYAASIEAQLEEYWQAAYTSSNYCEYFLPQHWQPTEGGEINYFSDHVLNIDEQGNVSISHTFVPVVERVSDSSLNAEDVYSLPQYTLKYNSNINSSDFDDNEVFASEVFKNNDAMIDIAEVLEIDYKDFSALKMAGKTTYYYSKQGGVKHSDLIKYLKVPTTSSFENYSGLYIMEIRWLRDHFTSYPLDGYVTARKEHDNIWQYIYSKYPAMMLESKYSNTDAIDSKQLLMLAKNYFKDLSAPERGYSITLIDNINSCIGYKGQELKIGDSIRLRANEFYEGFDDISSSLNQLLFITDIKYTLRKDADISLTVNAIKYQNKLIKRLARLIQ